MSYTISETPYEIITAHMAPTLLQDVLDELDCNGHGAMTVEQLLIVLRNKE